MSLLGNRCSCLRTPEEGCLCAGDPDYTLDFNSDAPLACPLRDQSGDTTCESCQ